MTMLRLDPPKPVFVIGADKIPRGMGLCHCWIDYGVDFDLHWLVGMHDTGEFWIIPNKLVREPINYTLGRKGAKNELKA